MLKNEISVNFYLLFKVVSREEMSTSKARNRQLYTFNNDNDFFFFLFNSFLFLPWGNDNVNERNVVVISIRSNDTEHQQENEEKIEIYIYSILHIYTYNSYLLGNDSNKKDADEIMLKHFFLRRAIIKTISLFLLFVLSLMKPSIDTIDDDIQFKHREKT